MVLPHIIKMIVISYGLSLIYKTACNDSKVIDMIIGSDVLKYSTWRVVFFMVYYSIYLFYRLPENSDGICADRMYKIFLDGIEYPIRGSYLLKYPGLDLNNLGYEMKKLLVSDVFRVDIDKIDSVSDKMTSKNLHFCINGSSIRYNRNVWEIANQETKLDEVIEEITLPGATLEQLIKRVEDYRMTKRIISHLEDENAEYLNNIKQQQEHALKSNDDQDIASHDVKTKIPCTICTKPTHVGQGPKNNDVASDDVVRNSKMGLISIVLKVLGALCIEAKGHQTNRLG